MPQFATVTAIRPNTPTTNDLDRSVQQLGKCRTVPPAEADAIWFPVHIPTNAEARKACRGCPVIAECRELGRDEEHGIWGATTPMQRANMRRRMKVAS